MQLRRALSMMHLFPPGRRRSRAPVNSSGLWLGNASFTASIAIATSRTASAVFMLPTRSSSASTWSAYLQMRSTPSASSTNLPSAYKGEAAGSGSLLRKLRLS